MPVFVWLHLGYLALEMFLGLGLSAHLAIIYRNETWACGPFAFVHSTSCIQETLLHKPGGNCSAVSWSSSLVGLRSWNAMGALTYSEAQPGT